MRLVNRRLRLLIVSSLLAALLPALYLSVALAFPGPTRAHYEMWQGDRRLAAREYGAALRHFAAAADAQPQDPVPHLRAAAIYWQQGQAQEAEGAWRAALDRDPGNAQGLLGLGRAAGAAGRHEATAYFRAALARDPTLAEARAELAATLAAQGDFSTARREWEQVLAAPQLDAGLKQRGHYEMALLLLVGEPATAKRHLDLARTAAAGVVPEDLLADAERTAGALASAGAVLAAADDDGEMAYLAALLGYTYFRADKLVPAQAQLERAIALRPDYGDALAYLAYTYWRQGAMQRALDTINRAVAAAPDSALVHYVEGTVLRAARRFPEAIAAFESAVRLSPEDSAVHLELARTLVASADYVAAGEAYERAALLRPGDAAVLLDAASFYLDHLFRIDRGLELAREAARVAPDSAAAQDALGWARHLSHDSDGAVEALRQAIALDPTFARAHYHLAVVYEKKGEREAAAAAYRRVLDLDVGQWKSRAEASLPD